MKSISFKLNSFITAFIILVLGSFGIYNYTTNNSKLLKQQENEINLLLDRLTLNLPSTIWNYDESQRGKILNSEIKASGISGIYIYDNEKLISSRVKDESGKIANDTELENKELTIEAELIFTDDGTDNKVGTAIIKKDLSAINQQLSTMLINTIVQILGIVIIIILTISLLIKKIVTTPLCQAVETSIKLANGDLTANIHISSNDEVGTLLSTIQDQIERLRSVVKKVNTVASSVYGGNKQLFSGVQELSSGASEQAASVEQISATLEESNASIQQNLESSKKTEQIASESANKGTEGGNAVRQTEEAMKTIAQKIGIIEDIAYQTNLLALNAAIEAARAGDKGRGFAVVASEVRKLAARSETAAGEISQLAKESVSVAEKARTQIEEIIPEINLTAELVQEITASSQEQSTGIEQINEAMSQLDRVTQSNAALAEELASTADEINSQAAQLTKEMEYFKTNESDAEEPYTEKSDINHDSNDTQPAKQKAPTKQKAPGKIIKTLRDKTTNVSKKDTEIKKDTPRSDEIPIDDNDDFERY